MYSSAYWCFLWALIACIAAIPIQVARDAVLQQDSHRFKRQIFGRNWEYNFGMNKDMMRKMQAGPFGSMIRNAWDVDGAVKLNVKGLSQNMFSFESLTKTLEHRVHYHMNHVGARNRKF